jgi:hypothetical protein
VLTGILLILVPLVLLPPSQPSASALSNMSLQEVRARLQTEDEDNEKQNNNKAYVKNIFV